MQDYVAHYYNKKMTYDDFLTRLGGRGKDRYDLLTAEGEVFDYNKTRDRK